MKLLLVLPFVFSWLRLALCSFQWATLERWQQWKQQYKQDFSLSDDCRRRAMWTHNFQLIANHNKDFLAGCSRFTMEMNKFGAMSDLEHSAMLGVKVGPGLRFSQEFQVPVIPSSLDYRTMGLVTAVKDQGVCGSSWAFGVTGAIEAQVAKTTGELVSLSEQNLMDCSEVNATHGCHGGWMGNAYEYIQTYGINKEADYPYLAKDDQPCLHDSGKNAIIIQGHITLPPGDENTLKMVLAVIGPITVAVDASSWSFMFYKMGIYDDPLCGASQVNHAVLLVGYGSENGFDYWIIKNSWGHGWGEKGYMRMLRGVNLCGIANCALYPLL